MGSNEIVWSQELSKNTSPGGNWILKQPNDPGKYTSGHLELWFLMIEDRQDKD